MSPSKKNLENELRPGAPGALRSADYAALSGFLFAKRFHQDDTAGPLLGPDRRPGASRPFGQGLVGPAVGCLDSFHAFDRP